MRHLLAPLVAVLLAAAANAQITPIPNSGCPTVPAITVSGSARIGTPLRCSCPPSIDRMRVILGVPSRGIVFGRPFMCLANCLLPMDALFLLPSPGWSTQIPNDVSFVGQAIVAQCLQTSLNRPCVLLTPAAQVRVLP